MPCYSEMKRIAWVFPQGGEPIYVLGKYKSQRHDEDCKIIHQFQVVHIGNLADTIRHIFYTTAAYSRKEWQFQISTESIELGIKALCSPQNIDPDLEFDHQKLIQQSLDQRYKHIEPIYARPHLVSFVREFESRGTPPTLANHWDLLMKYNLLDYLSVPDCHERDLLRETNSRYAYQANDGFSEQGCLPIQICRIRPLHYTDMLYLVFDQYGNQMTKPLLINELRQYYLQSIWKLELSYGGSYKDLIQRFEDGLYTLKPADAVIFVEPSKEQSSEIRLTTKRECKFPLLDVDPADMRFFHSHVTMHLNSGAKQFPHHVLIAA